MTAPAMACHARAIMDAAKSPSQRKEPEMSEKPIPKSLHTVRVVAIMAREYLISHYAENVTAAHAVEVVLHRLGYPAGTPDTHGIAAKAVKALEG